MGRFYGMYLLQMYKFILKTMKIGGLNWNVFIVF